MSDHLQGIGELTDLGTSWRLVYDRCLDLQLFARSGLENLEAAARFVRRNFAECLTCRAATSRPFQDLAEAG